MSHSTPTLPFESPFTDREARERERARKRDALMLAAVQMFNDRGFHATSLDDVAASLGVTKPVIYYHLGNKEQVLLACVRRGLEMLQEAVRTAQEAPGTGLDRLEVFLRLYAQINMHDFGRCVILTNDELLSPQARSDFRAVKRDIDQALRAMIEAAVADGSAAVEDIRMATFAITGALNWPARWHRDDGPIPAEQIATQLTRFLVCGLKPRQD